MGRKGGWFSSVKKAFTPESTNENKPAKRAIKSKKKWFGKEKPSASHSPVPQTNQVSYPHPVPPSEEENDHTKHAYSVAVATAAAAEAAVAAAQAAAEVVRLTSVAKFAGKSKEEFAAIKIQTAFRGYQARRALRALRGLVRLKSLVDGATVNRQTATALKSMQTLSRVHSQVQSRRIRMSEENRALQRQILQQRAKELESLRMGEEWNDSSQSKEQIEANLLHKYEAAMRRERALAYSYSHQQTWKKLAKSTNLLFMDPTNPHWGWSWLERWTAARTSETQTPAGKNLHSVDAEITKSFTRHQLNSDNASSPASQKPTPNCQSPASPVLKPASSSRKSKPASERGSAISQEDGSRSTFSVQSEMNRRHSIAGSSIRDDESMASSPSVPSYMAPTHSAKAKSRLPSPLGQVNGSNMPEKGSSGVGKKRLSFPPSPGRLRRLSAPPKVERGSGVSNDVNGVVSVIS